MNAEIHTLAGAYAVDAVSDIERAQFGEHLAHCPSCAVEVAELQETAARLAEVTAAPPPDRLRTAVLARASQTRQLGPGRAAPAGAGGAPRWRRWTAAAAAAALVAVAAGTVTYLVQERRVRAERLAAARASQIAAVLAAADARLHTGTVAGVGRVTVVVSAAQNRAVALLSGLPAPGADRAYQLWLVRAGTPVSAGVLAAGTRGGSKLIGGVRGAQTFAVTREPAGGSRTPTPPILAGISLA